jgi:hypothetical protein
LLINSENNKITDKDIRENIYNLKELYELDEYDEGIANENINNRKLYHLKNNVYNREYNTTARILCFKRISEEEKNYIGHKRVKYKGEIYEQIRSLDIETIDKIKKFENNKFIDTDDNFNDLLAIFMQDKNFDEFYQKVKTYLNMIVVINVNGNLKLRTNEEYIKYIFDSNNFDDNLNNSIYSRFITYDINKDAESFDQLLISININDDMLPNSCFFNMIIENFKNSFDKLNKESKRKYKILTVEYLKKLFGIDKNINQNIGISINMAVDNFLNYFNLGLDVINENEEIIFSFRPKKINSNISNYLMRILLTNDYVYLLNDNIKILDKLKNIDIVMQDDETFKTLYKEKLKLNLSSSYYLNYDKKPVNDIYIVNSLNNIINIIKNSISIKLDENGKKRTIKLINNDMLDKLLL